MKELHSYLNDHLAGSVSALELIADWADIHKGKPLGIFFAEIQTDIKADQETLHDVMRSLGVEESNVRKAGAWVAEKVGRARLMIAGDEPDNLGPHNDAFSVDNTQQPQEIARLVIGLVHALGLPNFYLSCTTAG